MRATTRKGNNVRIIRVGTDGQAREVEYNDAEMAAIERFDAALDQGLGVQTATIAAIHTMPHVERSAAFVEWLSDRTLTLDPGDLMVVPRQRTS
jgi:hypothetical protein